MARTFKSVNQYSYITFIILDLENILFLVHLHLTKTSLQVTFKTILPGIRTWKTKKVFNENRR